MSKPKALAALAALIGVSVVMGAVALGAQTFSPPKTPWGHPDLQGIYSNDDETGTPMERPAQFEGKTLADITPEELQKIIKQRNEQFVEGVSGTEFAGGLRPPAHLIFDTFDRKNSRAWLVVDPPDGRIPRAHRCGAAAPHRRRQHQRQSARAVQQLARHGPLRSLHHARHPRLDDAGRLRQPLRHHAEPRLGGHSLRDDSRGARHPARRTSARAPKDPRTYLGDARGWWEGNTLVVETTNFRPETAPQGATEHVVMTERFTAVSPNVVEWRVTFEDPNTWTRPWTYVMPLTKVDYSQQVFEYACHEGNHAMRNILSAARAAEK